MQRRGSLVEQLVGRDDDLVGEVGDDLLVGESAGAISTVVVVAAARGERSDDGERGYESMHDEFLQFQKTKPAIVRMEFSGLSSDDPNRRCDHSSLATTESR